MKTRKTLAMIMSTALCISNSVPFGFSEMNTYADSPVTVADTGNKMGDVNGDDAVDANDASMVLEEYTMLSIGKDSVLNEKQRKAADVDKNGDIDASDATIILSYYSYVSTGGKLDVEQFIELTFITPPVESTTTTTATTTKPTTTTVTSNSTAKPTTTTVTSNSTAKPTTTTITSNSTAKPTTTTITSNSTAKPTTTTVTSNSTAKPTTTTVTSNSTAKPTTTTVTSNSTAKPTTTTTTEIPTTTTTITTTTQPTTTLSETTSATTTIIPNQNISEIISDRNEINIAVGQSERITDIKIIPENAINREMKWESSDNNVAIVNNLGWIIGKNAGQCKIVISSVENPNVFAIIIVNVYDGEATTATTTATTTTTTSTTTTTTESTTTTTITTNIRVTGMSVSKNSITISVGGKDIPLVTMYPENAPDKTEIWISDNETVATVDKYGWITGVSVGECTITVYSANNPAVFTEIKVKVVDEDVPPPDINFSYILSEKSDSKNIAFYTPIPKNASGRFLINYVITDSNGNVSKVTSTILAPEMQGTVTMLTANTNKFTVEAFIKNIETDSIAKIGSYEFTLNPRDARTIIEDINYAFYVIKGLT